MFRHARARRAHVEATVHRCVAGQFAFRRDPGDGAGAFAQPRGIPPKELDALRKKLTERSVVRFVGLVCHLLYWSVLRPEFEGLAPPGGGAPAGPSDREREALFTEVLSCHAQIHAEMRSSSKHVDTVLAPVLHLALRCAIERRSVPKPNLQPDFNVSIFECVDTSSSAGLRELDESDRSVQKSAESTSI